MATRKTNDPRLTNLKVLSPMERDVDMNVGKKYDTGKVRDSLVPTLAMEEVMKVLEIGAVKYGDENWRKVEDLQKRYHNAADRHMKADLKYDKYGIGSYFDDETDLYHMAHAICCLMFKLEDRILTASESNKEEEHF